MLRRRKCKRVLLTVGEMLLAWVVTLPTAALLAALAYSLFRTFA
jgi:phosphate/sulfate permease